MSNLNPKTKQLEKYHFKRTGKEALSCQMNVKISSEFEAKLKKKKQWSQFVRDVVWQALLEEDQEIA